MASESDNVPKDENVNHSRCRQDSKLKYGFIIDFQEIKTYQENKLQPYFQSNDTKTKGQITTQGCLYKWRKYQDNITEYMKEKYKNK